MKQIMVNASQHDYTIYIQPQLLQDVSLLQSYLTSHQPLIVTNTTLEPLYAKSILTNLNLPDSALLVLPDGEAYKTLEYWQVILNHLLEQGYNRHALLIAIGGGVIGDITGFAAACYQRGVSYLQIPTSLLAQVDAAVGGKTAVNLGQAKNNVGAFYAPKAVLIDPMLLTTLPERDYRAGLAEVIKYALIADCDFFTWLEQHKAAILNREPAILAHMINRCCEIKASIVSDDERERGNRILLNLGHTFGHALESCIGYNKIKHGEAVAYGLWMAAQYAYLTQTLSLIELNIITNLIDALVLSVIKKDRLLPSTSDVITAMKFDKKNQIDGALRLISLQTIGQAIVVKKVDDNFLAKAVELAIK